MPRMNRAFREGLILGFIAYLSVAAFYAVFDLLAARGTLYTVNLLGKAVFGGPADAAALQQPIALDMQAMFWYDALHLVASLAVGMVVIALVAQAERRPSTAPLAFVTIVGGYAATIVTVGLLSEPIRQVLPWWTIVVANSSAVVLGGAYVLRNHPGAWRTLTPFAR